MLIGSTDTSTSPLAQHRAALYAAHRQTHRDHFTPSGAWVGPGVRSDTGAAREWLWHSFAFLAGDEQDVRLANAILAAAPNLGNHFSPVVASQLLVRSGRRLESRARNALIRIVNDGLPDAIDFALASTGVDNFSAMRAMLFLTASQVLERYDVPYPHRSIPDVYNCHRLQRFGRNVLRLLEDQLAQTELAEEFNSPTYSPITLLAITEIVNLVDDPVAVCAARRIERRLWDELLTFHHPVLQTTVGPFSRGYEVDRIAHASNWKVLSGLLGLSDTRVEQLLYPPQPGQVIHGGDLVAQQAIACWLAQPDYHVLPDLLAACLERAFPFERTMRYRWPGMGYKRSDGKVVLNVEGPYCSAGGEGVAHIWQSRHVAVGSMTESYSAQNVPVQVVYALKGAPAGLGDARTATLRMTQTCAGKPVLANAGAFKMRQSASRVTGQVRPYAWSAVAVVDCKSVQYELALEISEHLPLDRPVERVTFDDMTIDGSATLAAAMQGSFMVEDGSMRMLFTVSADRPVQFDISRSNGLLCFKAALPDAAAGVDFQLDVTERE